jgi:hypothetical protein
MIPNISAVSTQIGEGWTMSCVDLAWNGLQGNMIFSTYALTGRQELYYI